MSVVTSFYDIAGTVWCPDPSKRDTFWVIRIEASEFVPVHYSVRLGSGLDLNMERERLLELHAAIGTALRETAAAPPLARTGDTDAANNKDGDGELVVHPPGTTIEW